MSFTKSWNCTSHFGECNFAFWKTHKCKLIPNWKRKTVWLPISNIHEKICVKDVLNFTDSELSSQLCAQPSGDFNYHAIKKKLHHNCAIQGACLIWKQKIWLAICELLCSLTNQNVCFITFFCIQFPLFCTVLRKNCTVPSQSESSNFFMYIIRWKNVTDQSSVSGASYIMIDIPRCHFSFAVARSICERPGNLREASKFALLWVYFLRHVVRPILPWLCELATGFTACYAEFQI